MKNFIAVILCFFIISNHSLWAQWVQPTGPISGSVSCIFVSGNNVLAGIYDIGVCLSTDKGVNWKLVNNGLTDLTIYKIAICDSYYIVGTHAGAFRSSNIGANWELVSNGLNNNSVNSLAVIGNNIFAGTGGDGVYLSTNYGSNWTPVNNGLPPYLWLSSLTANGNNIYVGVPGGEWGGVYLSTNYGANWTLIGLPTTGISTIAVIGNYIFVGTPYDGVSFTSDGGSIWIPSGSFSFTVEALISSGIDIYAGTYEHGVYISKDTGSTWIQVGLNSSSIYALASNDINVFAGTSADGIWTRPIAEIKNISGVTNELPSVFSLSQNYPNPFNPSTTINYSLSKAGNVKITIYNSLGSKVSDIINEYKFAGNYSVHFNGANLPSGMYFYRLESGNYTAVRKLIFLK